MFWTLVYSVPLLATAAGVALLAAYVWKRRAVPAAAPLFGLLCGVAGWCIPCAFEPYSLDLHTRLLWLRLELPSIACLSVLYLLVAVQYTNWQLSRRRCAALFAVPVAIQIMTWVHSEWFWRRIWIDHSGPVPLTGCAWGPLFWCDVAYGWATSALAIFLIVRQLVRTSGPRRREAGIFLATTSFPILVNAGDILGLTPAGCPDLTPYAFGLTAAGITWVLFRYRFHAIVPIAWKSVFQSMRDGVLVLDSQDRVAAVNLAAERLLNRTEEKVIGRTIRSALAHYPTLIQLAEVTRGDGDIEVSVAGDIRICEVCTTGLRDRRHQLIARLLTIRDVTAARAAAQELKNAKQVAEAASIAKSEFLANMSHEIRTPMNGVLGITELLLEAETDPQRHSYLGMVKSSGESLLAILNDILDFSKIEANKLDLDQVSFDPHELLSRAVNNFGLRAEQKGLRLVCQVHDVPAVVVGDPARLLQVITNLLGNALKFTASGEIAVQAEVASRDGDSIVVHVSVRDSGIGISPEKQQKIFEPFAQADNSTTRKYGGTGLGLTICLHLVEMMGGRLWVESELGRGSRFHFTVHFGLSQQPRMSHPVDPVREELSDNGRAVACLKILLAEDNPVNQVVAVRLLEKRGHHVTVAANGRDALTAVQQGPFDLVLMDVQMPDMDGLEATAAIRQAEAGTHKHLPIFAMTAHAMKGDAERCRLAGMDGHLPKPIRPRDLYALVDACSPMPEIACGTNVCAKRSPAGAPVTP